IVPLCGHFSSFLRLPFFSIKFLFTLNFHGYEKENRKSPSSYRAEKIENRQWKIWIGFAFLFSVFHFPISKLIRFLRLLRCQGRCFSLQQNVTSDSRAQW